MLEAECLPGLTWLLQSLRKLHGLHLQCPFLCFGTPWSWADASNDLAHPGLLSTPGCRWPHKQNLQTKHISFTMIPLKMKGSEWHDVPVEPLPAQQLDICGLMGSLLIWFLAMQSSEQAP